MKKVRYAYLIAVILVFGLAFFTQAQVMTGNSRLTVRTNQQTSSAATMPAVSGTVKDGNTGKPLSGVLLSVVDNDLSTKTSVEGYFDFADLADGEYRLRVGISGYETKDVDILLENGLPVQLEILLYPEEAYTFSVEMAFERDTYASYDNAVAEAWKALDEVNRRFNNGELTATYNYQLQKVSIFDDTADPEDGAYFECTRKLHPQVDYYVAIDKNVSGQGGFFASPYYTILHIWQGSSDPRKDGPFSTYAIDALTHEFGHTRGAIDLYAMEVDGANNAVQHGAEFRFNEDSYMDYPYGATRWGDYAARIINLQGGKRSLADEYLLNHSRPGAIEMIVKDKEGTVIRGVSVKAYPVLGYSAAVGPQAVFTGATDYTGSIGLPYDIVGFDYKSDKNIMNAFILFSYEGQTFSSWLPLTVLNKAYWDGSEDTLSQIVTAPFVIEDKEDPSISIERPADGSKIYSSVLMISGQVSDDIGIDMTSFRLSLDDTQVETAVTYDGEKYLMEYKCEQAGQHRIMVSVKDQKGNEAAAESDFELAFIEGDVNHDATVNIFDLVIVSRRLDVIVGSPEYIESADITKDGVIDIFDLIRVARHFGESAAG